MIKPEIEELNDWKCRKYTVFRLTFRFMHLGVTSLVIWEFHGWAGHVNAKPRRRMVTLAGVNLACETRFSHLNFSRMDGYYGRTTTTKVLIEGRAKWTSETELMGRIHISKIAEASNWWTCSPERPFFQQLFGSHSNPDTPTFLLFIFF